MNSVAPDDPFARQGNGFVLLTIETVGEATTAETVRVDTTSTLESEGFHGVAAASRSPRGSKDSKQSSSSEWPDSKGFCTEPMKSPSRSRVRTDSKASINSRDSKGMRAAAAEKARDAFASVMVKVDPLTSTVMIAGSVLALCAGMVNAISYLALGAFVSHVTGTVSRVGLALEAGAVQDAGRQVQLVVSFTLGSMMCGILIPKSTVSFGGARYGYALVGNALLLVLAALTADHDRHLAACFAAAGCGLQNGMATSYSGAVIRTTHTTGITTDIGLLLGRMLTRCYRKYFNYKEPFSPSLRGRRKVVESIFEDFKKFVLLSFLLIHFLIGIIAGAFLHSIVGVHALYVPAGICFVPGCVYSYYRFLWSHGKRPSWTMNKSSTFEFGRAAALFFGDSATEDLATKSSRLEETVDASCGPTTLVELAGPKYGDVKRSLTERLRDLEPNFAGLLVAQHGQGFAQNPGSVEDLGAEVREAFHHLMSVVAEAERSQHPAVRSIGP